MQRLQCGNAEEVEDELRLPSQIRITRDIAYEVVFIKEFPQDPRSKYTTYGECRYEEKQIVIALNQSKTEQIKKFIHEALHAIEYEYKIEIPHFIVHLLENAIFKVLKLNGWMK